MKLQGYDLAFGKETNKKGERKKKTYFSMLYLSPFPPQNYPSTKNENVLLYP